MTWKRIRILLAIALIAGPSYPALAAVVVNGSFNATPGQLSYNTNATGWTMTPTGSWVTYNFIFASGTADSTGANGQYGNVRLWGPANGSANGLPASSPDGGSYLAADGVFQEGTISQTISGLAPGSVYRVGFWWGAAQQYTFDGATTERWRVTFGSQTQFTPTYNLPNHGFSGWMYQTMDFTASSSSQLLSFLALGTPEGLPPFVLLDGVTVTAVPEPTALLLTFLGFAGLGYHQFRRRRASRAAKLLPAAI